MLFSDIELSRRLERAEGLSSVRSAEARALLEWRLAYAAAAGCDVATMGALPGSASQRNAEREGFRIAYTRTKWRLPRGNA